MIPSQPRGHIMVSLEYDIHWQLNIAARNFVQLWHNNNLIHESRDFIRLLPFYCWREREREREERERVRERESCNFSLSSTGFIAKRILFPCNEFLFNKNGFGTATACKQPFRSVKQQLILPDLKTNLLR